MTTQEDILSSSPTKIGSRTSLSWDEFVLIEPGEAGEPPNEYCLQDEPRPRQFVPVHRFWSKLVPIGKAVTALVSSVGPSQNRATIVPCNASNVSSRLCECTKPCCCRSSSKKHLLQKGVAMSSFDEEDSPCVLQPIKLNSRDNSLEEYYMLKIRSGNADDEEKVSIPNGGIPVDTDPRICEVCGAKEEDGSTQLSSVNCVQCDSCSTEVKSEASLNGSLLSENTTGEQPSNSKDASIHQEFTGEESVDSAYSSYSGVCNASDFHVETPESSAFYQDDHIVELDGPIHVHQNCDSANKVDCVEGKNVTDGRSVAKTDDTAADNPSNGSCSEETCEGFCPTGDLRLFVHTTPHNTCPLQAPHFLMKKRHNLQKSSSEPTASDIISSQRLLEIHDSFLNTQRKRSASQPHTQQLLLCSSSKTNCRSVSGNSFTEEEIKATIREHCHEFVKYINWQSLLPFLESRNLLDPDSTFHLSHAHKSDQEKGNYFLLQVLPTKGRDAYQRFYSCIAQEKEHSGHTSLLEFFCT